MAKYMALEQSNENSRSMQARKSHSKERTLAIVERAQALISDDRCEN